jgi:hypothetical protein
MQAQLTDGTQPVSPSRNKGSTKSVPKTQSTHGVSFSNRREIIHISDEADSSPAIPFDPFRVVPQYSPSAQPDEHSHPSNGANLGSARQALFTQEQLQPIRWQDILSWSLASPASRATCADDFKALSCLLIHAGYHSQCAASAAGPSEHLLIRAPSVTFRKDVLLPIFTAVPLSSSVLITPALLFMKMVMYHQRILHFRTTYAESFFKCDSLKLCLQVSTWEMEEMFDPTTDTGSSWTVYSYLRCLSSQASTFDGLLPTHGISIIEAKHLGMFTYQLFRSMDMKEPRQTAAFDQSILASHLQQWVALTDHPMIHPLWQREPRALTYWWFFSLREILFQFQTLALTNRFLPDSGFLPDEHQLTISPYCGIDGPHISLQLNEAAVAFQRRWADSRLSSSRSFMADVQEHHFRMPTIRVQRDKPPKEPRPVPSGAKRPSDSLTPHFTSAKPLFKLLGEPPWRLSAVPGKFLRFQGPQSAPMFRIPDSTGKSRQICLKSSCEPPYNVCSNEPCVSKRPSRNNEERVAYIHVDLSDQYWCSVVESTWDPLVQFLKGDGVHAHIQPTAALKALTPSAGW